MAVIKCPECKGKMSTEADACPACGYKLTEGDKAKINNTKPWYKKWWGVMLIALVGVFMLGMFLPSKNGDTPNAPTSSANMAKEPGQDEFEEGFAAFWNDNYRTAFKAFEKGAALGNKDAKALLGSMYVMGESVKEDTKKGFNLVQEAANEGSAFALVEMAYYYFNGYLGLKKDTQTGYNLMSKAYDTGHWYPAHVLARFYSKNNSPYGARDIEKSNQYIDEAARRGMDKKEVAAAKEGLKKIPDYEVTVAQITKEYDSNEVAADNKYKGKTIRITGRVDTVGKDIMGSMYVTLKHPDQWSIRNVQFFFFDKNQADEIANLSKGQETTIQGTVSGLMMNVLVKKCWIVE